MRTVYRSYNSSRLSEPIDARARAGRTRRFVRFAPRGRDDAAGAGEPLGRDAAGTGEPLGRDDVPCRIHNNLLMYEHIYFINVTRLII